jgi:hypothetical protein
MRTLFAIPLLLSVLAAAPAPAETVTAAWNLETDMNSYAGIGAENISWKRGQTFTAEQSGQIVSASFRLQRASEFQTTDLQIELFELDATGLPQATPLHTNIFAPDGMNVGPPSLPLTYVFDGERPVLQAGTGYALVLTGAVGFGGVSFYLNGYFDARADYDGGSAVSIGYGETEWTRIYDGQVDFGFRVTVDETVPTEQTSFGSIKALYR